MSSIVIVARILLTVVFGTAAVTKLTDLNASRDTVEAFGVPRRYARYAGTALPFAELAVAAAILPQASARWGALAALLLLLVFTSGVCYALSQGRTPDCNCFGQVSSAQISWRTVARNGALLLIAALAVWKSPGSSLSAWTTSNTAANLVASLAVISAALLAVSTFYFRGRGGAPATDDAPDGGLLKDVLGPGEEAPYFELANLAGAPVSRDALLARGLPMVLVFASPTCGPCLSLMPELARWHAALNERLTLVVVESGVTDNKSLGEHLRALGDVEVLVEPGRELANAYHVQGTPTGIAISPEGKIASPPLPGSSQLESLIRTVLRTGGQVPERTARPLAGQRG